MAALRQRSRRLNVDVARALKLQAGFQRDTVAASTGTDNTLSLGGGIDYDDLSFKKSGSSLILNTGARESITFANWYAGGANKSVVKLQVIAESMDDYDAGGADPLRDQKVEFFDFQALVNAFDAAGNPTNWALTHALLTTHLGGSDTEAIGGALAYQYGAAGSLAGIGVSAAGEIVGDAAFGTGLQDLDWPGLNDGVVMLT